ncbi:MAG: hypothetical protein ACJAXS_001635 [Colwellia sp.]|jgi:hypothetical protein
MINIPLCSGFGQFHSNEQTSKAKKPYGAITLTDIRLLIDSPQQVDKPQAQWLIPSTLPSRNFKTQEQQGEYYFLWADLDEQPPTINDLGSLLFVEFCCDYEIYTSSSATEDKQKSRILIPLNKPLSGVDWVLAQTCLNDWLQSQSITPDRAAERTAQLCYLPNEGKYYKSDSCRDGDYFEPLVHFSDAIEEKKKIILESEIKTKRKLEQAKAKRQQRIVNGFESPIDEFNNLYLIEDILIQSGYEQRGNTYRHPKSESGSYSASVKANRVHALSNTDPLSTNGAGAHDAFSAFKVLFHSGDNNAALKDACDNWLSINGESWNKVKQREFSQVNQQAQTMADFQTLTSEVITDEYLPLNLSKFSICGDIEAMEKQMLDDVYVLGKLAILGQSTVFYAGPNTGKTLMALWLLDKAIESGQVKANDVYYVNADDNQKGLTIKGKIAQKKKFHMLAPGYKGFQAEMLLPILNQLNIEKQARGKIFILDTLKKFTSLMDKKSGAEFGIKIREFISNGGTLIALAHTNKNRNDDGKLVFEGTGDMVNDVDCAYMIDTKENISDAFGTKKVIVFENIKSRGDVEQEVAYRYQKLTGGNYNDLFNSVQPIEQDEVKQASKRQSLELKLAEHTEVINCIESAINGGTVNTNDIIKFVIDESQEPRRKVVKVLKEHTGNDWNKGHRWDFKKGDKNAKEYFLIMFHQVG